MAAKEEGKPYDTVCFHCQQAAEKSLKAYLVHLEILFPKTHNIGQLIEIGMSCDPGLELFISAEDLSPYGVDVRYPDDFYIPTEEDARGAFAMASDLVRYVKERI